MTAQPSKMKSGVMVLALTLWCCLTVAVFLVVRLASVRLSEHLYPVFHAGMCRISGLRLRHHGKVQADGAGIYVCNHISYLDVFALGVRLPGYFIAKSEVSGWPILGSLARLQNTLFLKRDARQAKQQINTLSHYLDQGRRLILFPEGTSTNGLQVLPFKSSLFESTQRTETDAWIQPVTISYDRYQGEPLNDQIRDRFAWYARMPFASHFFAVLGLGQCEINLFYHPVVRLTDFESRKACAQFCAEQINAQLQAFLHQANTASDSQPLRSSALKSKESI